MTKEEEALALKSFKNLCTCGGYARSINGRPEQQPHMAWCPQYEEYAEWYRAMNESSTSATRQFEARHIFFKDNPVIEFSEHDAPDWLTGKNTVPGSTMDNRWFWQDHVLTLGVGESVKTDFHTITRRS